MSDEHSRKQAGAGDSGSDGKKLIQTKSALQRLSAKRMNELGESLYYACGSFGNTARAKLLIDRGAPITWRDEHGVSSLHKSSLNGHTETMELLLELKINVNIKDKYGNTPLLHAARANKMTSVRTLVEAGADITVCAGYHNKTAADEAKFFSHHAIAEYLLTEAPRIRFHSSYLEDNGQLNRVKGRSFRAIERDFKDNGTFDTHMIHRLKRFCMGKR